MNTHTHTQGPWHIGVRQPTSGKFIYGPQGEEIADCDRRTNFDNENLANARLIAAAPDLLAALKGLYGLWNGDYNSPENAAARAAIAKAERGESMIENTFIIIDHSTGKAVCELGDKLAAKVNEAKFQLVRPSDYLPTLNIKGGAWSKS